MTRPVFVEVDEDGEWFGPSAWSAAVGFKQRGYDTRPFVFSDLATLDLEGGKAIVAGTIRSVRGALKLLGKPVPPTIDIPDSLKPWTKRKIWTSTLKEVRKSEDAWPMFVKPLEDHKAFRGMVFRDFRDAIATAAFPDDMKVLCSEVVQFHNEWRVFVCRGDILDVRHYAGNLGFDGAPSEKVLQDMIAAFGNEAPAAYSIDVGLVKHFGTHGEIWDLPSYDTLLVEVNDGFALGTYGLRDHLYVKMIEARWNEMVK